MTGSTQAGAPQWSIVLAYYNEADFIVETLQSIVAQAYRPFDLILIDNASKDNSAELAHRVVDGVPGINAIFLHQPEPGQIHALNMGIATVRTPYVAICDADTHYPPQYLEQCALALRPDNPGVVGVMATDIYGPPGGARALLHRAHVWLIARLLRKQTHTGGYAYAFRTQVLRDIGSYDVKHWPYVLSDHEIAHRALKKGSLVYPFGHWCMPSTRRPDDPSVRWSLGERLLYHATPHALKDWFFYSFLARRFEARRMKQTNYRVQPWEKKDGEKAD